MNSPARRVASSLVFLAAAFLVVGAAFPAAAQVSLTTLGTPYTQSFDTLPASGSATWTNNSTIPGWFHARTGTGTTIVANDGSSNAGNFYSYGTGTATERALGSVGSGNAAIGNLFWGVRLQNNTGSTITSLEVSYTGEQWRNSAAAAQTIAFSYLIGSPTVTGSLAEFQSAGTPVTSLDFTSPITGGTAGAINGNSAANRVAITYTISGLNIPNGTEVMLRWSDPDQAGADHGLSIDDFSVTPNPVVADTAPSVSSTSPANGASGVAATISPTVTFSEPVNVTGNWFQIACPTSGTRNVSDTVVSGGPTTFTIDPNTDFANGEACTATVFAAQVEDQDSNDPPGTMAANYVFSFTIAAAPVTPNLSINDVTLVEGNSGTTTFSFTVSLDSPAGAGGVAFDVATADGTAQDGNPVGEDDDYAAKSTVGQTIAAGSSSATFDVVVNGDLTNEPNETFFVNVTNVTGANVTDGQGQGTITNDDPVVTPIHDIQGPGGLSPIVSLAVTTRGIVTGTKFNAGFFIQEPDATVDADPATSEGVFVYTGSPVPATAVVGNLVQVTGTVAEYVPGADPFQPPLTEIVAPLTISVLTTGNPLPAPVPLTPTFPDPAGPYDQLERVEAMRVVVASLDVVAPTTGSKSEANATATSNGRFHGVVTGVARPFREAGIQHPDPAPAGSAIPPIARWDTNPELLRIESWGQIGSSPLNVPTGATVTNVVGPLDYSFRRYAILPDVATPPVPAGSLAAVAVPTPLGSEFTVASYNLERFYDAVNDPGVSDVALTPTAYDNRLGKASRGIRDYLKTPDILGIVEIENLTTLQALAARIGTDAIAAGQPDPQYAAYLVEGNDVGGIDVGFLVKTAEVAPGVDRVEVVAVQQELAGTLLVNPDSSTELLNDRPPLRLNAIVHHANGASFPVTVIVNHMKALTGVDDPTAGSNGWTTKGARDRAKRQKQAEDLANLVQARQTADPTERIVLVGDFNAYEFNDGYVDMTGVITGLPAPDAETAVPGDGIDLVNPDLDNLFDTAPAAQRYTYVFDGNAQSIDHALVNAPLVADTLARRLEHPRLNADFPEVDRSLYGPTDVTRLGDHDPIVAFFQVAAFLAADLSVAKADAPDPVVAGTNLTYTITVGNAGPDPAANASFSDTLPAGTTFVSLSPAAGWSCTTPAVGGAGLVSCSNPSFAVGSAVFTLTVAVDPAVAAGTVVSNTATATSATADPNAVNNSATATTTVAAQADISVTKVDSPDPVMAGSDLAWTITVANAGPSDAQAVSLSDTLPAGTTFVSLSPVAGWTCTSGATVSCSIATLPAGGNAVFTLVAAVAPSVTGGTVLSNTATISAATSDPDGADNSATATTTVNASSGVSIAKTAAPEPVAPGGTLTWTVTLTNLGPSAASDVTWSDTLPAGATFGSLAAAAGWTCTTGATVSCSIASFPVGTAVFSITGTVAPATPLGSVLSNTASITAVTGDTDPGDNASTSTTNVLSPAVLAATKTASGTFVPGGTVTYTIVLTNSSATEQADNAGDELVDVLPPALVLVSSSATSGTTVTNVGANTVTWNGAIPAGGTVTVTIVTTVSASATLGQAVSNQATVSFDADGNGTNESTAGSDDPATVAAGDPTVFAVGAAASATIPTLGGLGLALLALLVALGGALVLGRRLS